MNFSALRDTAAALDKNDPLRDFKKEFSNPKNHAGDEVIYFCGNSLGLAPKRALENVKKEFEAWEQHGVHGYADTAKPWVWYSKRLEVLSASIVGAKPEEVVIMNSLTVNLHLMLVSFYRPTPTRYKILVEKNPFPSDRYALQTHLCSRGIDPAEAIIEMEPRPGEELLREEDILRTIDELKSSLALVFFGQVNFITGQSFRAKEIGIATKKAGAKFGLDLAHSIGNVPLAIHDWGCDFAVWCYYKYMNGGPGVSGGCFVHEKYIKDQSIPRFAGWFGHNLSTRLQMPKAFDPSLDASGWQLSNSPILQLAALETSLEIFDQAKMPRLREKSKKLTGLLYEILVEITEECGIQIITPKDPENRGAQLSIRSTKVEARELCQRLTDNVVCDARDPNILRLAPTPLYNSFAEVVGACEKIYSVCKRG